MNDTLRSKLASTLSEIVRLRDELRVRMHLARAELRDEWKRYEPQLLELEDVGKSKLDSVAADLESRAENMLARLRALREKLNRTTGQPTKSP